MRSALIQLLLAAAMLIGTFAVWIAYVPASLPFLERMGVLGILGIEAQAARAPDEQRRRAAGPVPVVTAPVGQGALNNRITAIGNGLATRSVSLTAEAAGKVVAVDAISGSYVEQGATILKLEDEAEAIAVERARILLADAQADVTRLSRLDSSGATTAVAMQTADLELKTAQLALRDAELKLSQRAVIAPISGWIGLVEVEPGDRIQQQEEIAVIADRSAITIAFAVPERVISQLRIGGTVEVVPLASPDQSVPGLISAIDNIVDRSSRSLRVQAEVTNQDDALRPGMAFEVNLEFIGDTLLSVPPLSVQWSSQGSFVWVVRDGKVVRVAATIRQRNADSVLVEADLLPEEQVVVEGVQSLRPGAEVELVQATDGPMDAAAPTAAIGPGSL